MAANPQTITPPGLFDKLRPIAEARQMLDAVGVDPFGTAMQDILKPTEAIIQGRHTILVGTNNYLGLTFDQEAVKAAQDTLGKLGTGTTGSRMANGSFDLHRQLEKEFAEFYGMRDCIVFSTGYLANLGVLSALGGPQDVIVLDADCHASIYDGCKLGGAEVIRFRHNDPDDLAKRLRRLKGRAANALIVVEGLYSMLGDVAPLKEIAAVKKEFGCYLVVDEAHSLGVYGETGRGVAQAQGCEDDVDFTVGTFSKSLGATGGFCVSQREELDLIRYASRPYIFTASPAPSVIASTRVTLRKMAAGKHLRENLFTRAKQLHQGLAALNYDIAADSSPVIGMTIKGKENALSFWKQLLENGVYCNLVLPPATPSGDPLLRISLSAAHTAEQIDQVLSVFATMKPALDCND